jgi:hypothetical protein
VPGATLPPSAVEQLPPARPWWEWQDGQCDPAERDTLQDLAALTGHRGSLAAASILFDRKDQTVPKSSFSNISGECVCVDALPGGHVAVRDSKLADASPVLVFEADAWEEFLTALTLEALDDYAGPVRLLQADNGAWLMYNAGRAAMLVFTAGEITAFAEGVRNHEFTSEALKAAQSVPKYVMASGHQNDATKPPEDATGARRGQVGEVVRG